MAIHPFDYETALAACAQGDESALQKLYWQEAPHMLALCSKMLAHAADAQEAVQDAFVLIWKNADNYDADTGTARAWIYSIMRYRVLNRLRQSGRPSAASNEWTAALPQSTDPGQPSAVLQSLQRLNDVQRRPILMAFYNGLTYDQIAVRLGTSLADLKAHVHAGLRAIQEVEQA